MLRTHRRPIRPSHSAAALIACGLMLCVASPVFAQLGQGGQTGGGQTGGGQTGGGLGGGGTGGGAGGVTTGGPGSLGGSLTGPELMTFGADVDVTGGTGFVGRGNATENFVGGLVQGQGTTQSPFGAGGRGNNSMFQGISRQGQGQFRGQFQQPTGPSRSERIRPRHRIAFDFTPRQTETITTNLQTRVTSFAGYTGNPDGVAVTVNGQGVATLNGTVGDERSSRLAAALARLEPGVRSVDNQLTVAPQTP